MGLTDNAQAYYSEEREAVQVVMALDIGVKMGEEEPVRLLSAVIERMELGALRKASLKPGRLTFFIS